MEAVMVEEIRHFGRLWAVYDDGRAYEVGTGRVYPDGADALRADALLERMWWVTPASDSFRDGVEQFWRMHVDTWDLIRRSPRFRDFREVLESVDRAFGIPVRPVDWMPVGSVELAVEA